MTGHPLPVLLICAFIMLSLGWGQDGINLDSTTYSVIARNMVEQGRWFNPTYTPYYHTTFAEHPPLVMWIQAIMFLLFGISDSTARLFGALCTAGSVAVIYLLGKEVGGRRLGFLSGLALLFTYNFFQSGNSTLLDVPMTFFLLVALWGLARLHNGESVRPRFFWVVGFALGLGFLAKGVVSAPAWIAVAVTVLFWHRDWMKSKRLWLIPAVALGLILGHLLLDYVYTGGHFTRHYFLTQIGQRMVKGGPEIHTEWYEFSYRFLRLYLPFVLLLPLGIYLAVKRRMTVLYPALVTLVFYFLFYSASAKLYYHYFCPAYALAAPFVALPISRVLKDGTVRRLQVWFLAIWVLVAAVVTIAGVQIHHIRCPELYSLKVPMFELLEGRSGREGLTAGQGQPDWDWVAKTSWYWRSDIKKVATVYEAVGLLKNDGRFAYILLPAADRLSAELQTLYKLRAYADNGRVVVYVDGGADAADTRP